MVLSYETQSFVLFTWPYGFRFALFYLSAVFFFSLFSLLDIRVSCYFHWIASDILQILSFQVFVSFHVGRIYMFLLRCINFSSLIYSFDTLTLQIVDM